MVPTCHSDPTCHWTRLLKLIIKADYPATVCVTSSYTTDYQNGESHTQILTYGISPSPAIPNKVMSDTFSIFSILM